MKNRIENNFIAYIACLMIVVLTLFSIFYYCNWKAKIFISQDISQILTCITILLTVIGAGFAYYKWLDEQDKELEKKEKEKKEKLLTGVTAKFISCIIKQEIYRGMALKGNGLYNKNNLPFITSRIENASGYSVIMEVDKNRVTEVLSDADNSYADFELLCLINQYLLYDSIERLYKENASNNLRINGRAVLSDEQIQNELWDIYLKPDDNNFGHVRSTPYGQEYAIIVKEQKKIEVKLINKMIEEYNRELTALEIQHDLITWDNILEKTIALPESMTKLNEKAQERARAIQEQFYASCLDGADDSEIENGQLLSDDALAQPAH